MSLSARIPYNARFAAIKFTRDLNAKFPSLVRLYPQIPTYFYWGLGGITCCTYDADEITIVKDYGMFSDHDEEAIEKIEREFYEEHKPIPAPTLAVSEGWLSPEGVFYDCKFGGHSALAYHLGMSLFRQPGGERMIEKTWVRIYKATAVIAFDGLPTPAQMKMLRDMVDANPNEHGYLTAFRDFCELRDLPHYDPSA